MQLQEARRLRDHQRKAACAAGQPQAEGLHVAADGGLPGSGRASAGRTGDEEGCHRRLRLSAQPLRSALLTVPERRISLPTLATAYISALVRLYLTLKTPKIFGFRLVLNPRKTR